MKPFRPPMMKRRGSDLTERSDTASSSDYQPKKQRVDVRDKIILNATTGARKPLNKILNAPVAPAKAETKEADIPQEAYYQVLW
jgi:hypothetical protein